MKKGQDIAVPFPGLQLVHHNLPGFHKKEVNLTSHLLFLPLQGEISLKAEGRTFAAGPGRMLYLPPGMPHSFVSSQSQGERLIALIEPKLWTKKGGAVLPALAAPLNQLVKEVLFYLLLSPKTKYVESLLGVLVETLGESLDLVSESESLGRMEHMEARVRDPRVATALEFMRTHHAKAISMNEVAKKSGLSLRSLNRLVFEQTGFTPRKALICYRVTKAQELLLTPGASVTAVAFEVGYGSLSQFISAFRSVTGQLPSEYAKLAGFRRS